MQNKQKSLVTKNKVPISIRAKITLPFLILAIAIIVGAAFILTRIVFDTIEERFTNQLMEGAQLASESMVVEEDKMLETLRLLAFSDGVADALMNGDPERLRELTFGQIINNQQEAVEFLDTSGNLVLSMRHRANGRIEEYEFLTGGQTEFAQLDFVQKVLHENVDILGNKYAGLVQIEQSNYFYIAGPVQTQDGELVGVILVGKSLPTLAQQMREQTLAQITYYSNQGEVITSTFIEPAQLTANEANTVLNNQNTSSFQRDTSRNLNVRNIGYRELLGVWEARGNADIGLIGVSLGESYLVSTTRVTRLQIGLLASVV